jgi:chromatin segregation and condensation protein Rec8/ScpA/Scc1 (kleisin family)
VEDAQEKGEGKKKEYRKVGEGDDVVVIEDSSDDEDEEMLQERFQLRSRFSRAEMPNIPVIIKKPTSLEASLPVPPRKTRNVARKRATKKLKISETTSQEVSTMTSVVEYFP